MLHLVQDRYQLVAGAYQRTVKPTPHLHMPLALAASCCSEVGIRLKSAQASLEPLSSPQLLSKYFRRSLLIDAGLLASELQSPAASVTPAAARLRRELVRLIGVNAWESTDEQNAIREADGLPLLLSLTRGEPDNPRAPRFITS